MKVVCDIYYIYVFANSFDQCKMVFNLIFYCFQNLKLIGILSGDTHMQERRSNTRYEIAPGQHQKSFYDLPAQSV